MLRSLAFSVALVAASAASAFADSGRHAQRHGFVFFGSSPAFVQPFNPNLEQSFRHVDGRFSSFDRHRGGSVLLLIPQQHSFIIERRFRLLQRHRQFLLQPFSPFNPRAVVSTPNHFGSELTIVSPARTLQFATVFNRSLGSTFLVVLPPCKPARIAIFE